jgi:outer membrane lipoprotein-sorting protein
MISFLRTASPRALTISAAAAVALLVGGPVIATGAGGNSTRPEPKPLAQALADAAAPKTFDGVTARISFTNNLLDSVDMGMSPSPLLGSGTGRLWASADGKVRIELQSNSGGGDVQMVADNNQAWMTMGDGSTVYRTVGTAKDKAYPKGRDEKRTPLTVKSIETAIKSIAGDVTISDPSPDNVGGQPAYTVTISPVDTSGLLAGARVSWAASNGAPLAIAFLAKGESDPVMDLRATDVTFGPVDASVFTMKPPSGAKITDLNLNQLAAKAKAQEAKGKASRGLKREKPVTGLARVQASVSFKITAPTSLAGLDRSNVVLIGKGRKAAVAVTFGTGMNSIAVIERPVEGKKTSKDDSGFELPTKQIAGLTVTELGTPLGSLAEFERGGVAFTVLGSVPLSKLESAVAGL